MATQRESIDRAADRAWIGVDLGGTNLKLGLFDSKGQRLAAQSIAAEVSAGPERGVERIVAAVHALVAAAGLQANDVEGLGIGTPGPLDLAAGKILTPSNLPLWWHYPIRERLAAQLPWPVVLLNDATAAGMAEFWAGRARGFSSMVLITLGTGVGGAILVGDLALEGENGAGAEVGHLIIDYNESARPCPCGLFGHLEGYVNAAAVVQRTREALAAGRPSLLAGRGGDAQVGTASELTPLVVAEAAERGDALALEIVLETARFLGMGIASLVHTIDPAIVVLGGALNFGGSASPVGRRFLEEVRAETRRRVLPLLAGRTVIDFAELGADTGTLGAAMAAQRRRTLN